MIEFPILLGLFVLFVWTWDTADNLCIWFSSKFNPSGSFFGEIGGMLALVTGGCSVFVLSLVLVMALAGCVAPCTYPCEYDEDLARQETVESICSTSKSICNTSPIYDRNTHSGKQLYNYCMRDALEFCEQLEVEGKEE